MSVATKLLILSAAGAGFAIASYILVKKHGKAHVVCPARASCDFVINSDFSRFLGIPVELMGVAYYLFVASAYAAALFLANGLPPATTLAVLAASAGAFLFSCYLTFIQAFVIREWCTWCLMSAALCAVIFFAAGGASPDAAALLAANAEAVRVLFLLAMAVGVGGITGLFIFFAKFLDDLRMSEWEKDIVKTQAELTWIALGSAVLIKLVHVMAAGGPPPVSMPASAAVFAVIVAVSAHLNFSVLPKLAVITFGRRHPHEPGELHSERRAAIVSGGAAVLSWYFAFVLAAAGAEWEPAPVLGVYVILLLAAAGFSLLFERTYSR